MSGKPLFLIKYPPSAKNVIDPSKNPLQVPAGISRYPFTGGAAASVGFAGRGD
jgi:hypothetical protein